MWYVQRDAAGNINGVFANPQDWIKEPPLADDHPEIVAWFKANPVPGFVLKTDGA